MNYNQHVLINLLAASIRNKEPEHDSYRKADWKEVFKMARAHRVEGLAYYSLKKSDSGIMLDHRIKSKCEIDMLLSGIIHIRQMQQMKNVLAAFQREEISVIALKGLVLKELYPQPELRTMSDADILVNRKEITDAKNLLLEIGYREEETTSSHIRFSLAGYLPIELHWTLADPKYNANISIIEKDLWDNVKSIKVCGIDVFMLSFEDHVLHLCLHMSVHFISSGFGLRQLCDLVLLVEAHWNEINWDLFLHKVKECGIERFVLEIFRVCKKLFDMNISEELFNSSVMEDNSLRLLINDIFLSGVFGRRTLGRTFSSELLRYSACKDVTYIPGKRNYFQNFLFPPRENLSDRYAYARKTLLYIPIAWVHHLFCGLLNKDYSFTAKMSFLFTTNSIFKRRSKLLQWLNLQ